MEVYYHIRIVRNLYDNILYSTDDMIFTIKDYAIYIIYKPKNPQSHA